MYTKHERLNSRELVTDIPPVNLRALVVDLYWKNQKKWCQTTCITISGSQIVSLISAL